MGKVPLFIERQRDREGDLGGELRLSIFDGFGIWILGFVTCLEFGCWEFGVCLLLKLLMFLY